MNVYTNGAYKNKKKNANTVTIKITNIIAMSQYYSMQKGLLFSAL